MSEIDDILGGPDESTCSECHRFFNVKTGELVKGMEKVYVISTGPLICGRCKEDVRNALEKAVQK